MPGVSIDSRIHLSPLKPGEYGNLISTLGVRGVNPNQRALREVSDKMIPHRKTYFEKMYQFMKGNYFAVHVVGSEENNFIHSDRHKSSEDFAARCIKQPISISILDAAVLVPWSDADILDLLENATFDNDTRERALAYYLYKPNQGQVNWDIIIKFLEKHTVCTNNGIHGLYGNTTGSYRHIYPFSSLQLLNFHLLRCPDTKIRTCIDLLLKQQDSFDLNKFLGNYIADHREQSDNSTVDFLNDRNKLVNLEDAEAFINNMRHPPNDTNHIDLGKPFIQRAGIKPGFKEAVVDYIRNLDDRNPRKKTFLLEALTEGTDLHQFFAVKRGLFNTRARAGSFQQLSKMLAALDPTLSSSTTRNGFFQKKQIQEGKILDPNELQEVSKPKTP